VDMHGEVDEARFADAVIHVGGAPARQLMNDKQYLRALSLRSDQFVAGVGLGALILQASGLYAGGNIPIHTFVKNNRASAAPGGVGGAELDRWIISELIGKTTADACLASVGITANASDALSENQEIPPDASVA
jgi:hypothetical protein